jgi:glutamine amidotransferase-like uncharacterized protein
VAHACNPRYLRGRNQEHHSLRSGQAKLVRAHLNKKVGCGGVAQGVGPEFKPQYCKKKKKRKNKKYENFLNEHYYLLYKMNL